MKELRTEIEIQASPEKVWQVLADLAKWPEWNPSLRAVGAVKLGEKVEVSFGSGSKAMTLHCVVTQVQLCRELSWKYHVILPALFSGEHIFSIEPLGANEVRFVDREVFNGLLVPLQAKDIDTNSKRGFEEMDKALKARAEQF